MSPLASLQALEQLAAALSPEERAIIDAMEALGVGFETRDDEIGMQKRFNPTFIAFVMFFLHEERRGVAKGSSALSFHNSMASCIAKLVRMVGANAGGNLDLDPIAGAEFIGANATLFAMALARGDLELLAEVRGSVARSGGRA